MCMGRPFRHMRRGAPRIPNTPPRSIRPHGWSFPQPGRGAHRWRQRCGQCGQRGAWPQKSGQQVGQQADAPRQTVIAGVLSILIIPCTAAARLALAEGDAAVGKQQRLGGRGAGGGEREQGQQHCCGTRAVYDG